MSTKSANPCTSVRLCPRPEYGPTRITRIFKNTITMFPLSRPLTLNREAKGVNLLPLVNSMPSSYEKLGKEWLKTGKGNFDAKTHKKGPFTIGALAEIKLTAAKPARSRSPAVKKPAGREQDLPGGLRRYGFC